MVATSTQPALAAIRLAWWREALERLDRDPPPPEPRLAAAGRDLLTRGIGGARLALLEDGWAALLDQGDQSSRIAARGAILFGIAADLLGARDALLAEAGQVFALADVARRGLHPGGAVSLAPLAGHRFEPGLRPLTALARLAVRDVRAGGRLEPEATPARALALLAHRLSGKLA